MSESKKKYFQVITNLSFLLLSYFYFLSNINNYKFIVSLTKLPCLLPNTRHQHSIQRKKIHYHRGSLSLSLVTAHPLSLVMPSLSVVVASLCPWQTIILAVEGVNPRQSLCHSKFNTWTNAWRILFFYCHFENYFLISFHFCYFCEPNTLFMHGNTTSCLIFFYFSTL